MKKIYTLSILFLFNFIFSQRTTVASNVARPIGIIQKDNILYVAEANLNRISKIDITQSFPTSPIPYIDNLSRPNFMAIKDNVMFFTEFAGGRISKVNLSETTPTVETVLFDLNNPFSLIVIGNFLYYSENGNISKIDVTLTNPIPQIVISGLSKYQETGMVNNGNDLYYSEISNNTISKIDISQSNPSPVLLLSELSNPIGNMVIKDNILYFAENSESRISTLNLNELNPQPQVFDTNIDAIGFEFIGNDLYTSDFINGYIYKYDMNLSTNESTANSFTFFPNPTSDFLYFNAEYLPQSVSIFDLNGKLIRVEKGFQNKIDIRDLSKGLYLLNIITKDGFYDAKKIFKK